LNNLTAFDINIPQNFNFIIDRQVHEGETNDVLYGYGSFENSKKAAYVKINKNPKLSLVNEYKLLKQLFQSDIEVAKVLWHGSINRETLIIQALQGNMLWDYIDPRRELYNEDKVLAYLFEYGRTLAEIHSQSVQCDKQIRQKLYNILDAERDSGLYDFKEIINWLEKQNVIHNFNTFVHGDFNLANVLMYKDKVSGVIDWEFAGMGWKEYDLAWTLRTRLTFLNKQIERSAILDGYLSVTTYDEQSLRWCEVLNYLHFAGWSIKSNPEYTLFAVNKAKELINR